MTIYLSEKAAARAGLTKPRQKRGRATRPDLPRAAAGEGNRLEAVKRIAVFGYGPCFDMGVGFCFWQPSTGARTSTHAEYAAACVAAERELRG